MSFLVRRRFWFGRKIVAWPLIPLVGFVLGGGVSMFSQPGGVWLEGPQAGVAGELKPPAGLRASDASSTAIHLVWVAGDPRIISYQIERRVFKESWKPLTQVVGTQFTDSHIDPLATYHYRIRAMKTAVGHSALPLSAPSNEVVVGPPPVDFSLAAAAPSSINDFGHFGSDLSLTLDGNGDPAMAYLSVDPLNVGNESASALQFVAWDRANYRWTRPVTAASVEQVNREGSRREVSLAYDVSRKVFGIAYQAGAGEIAVAFSDDHGATWKAETVAHDPDRRLEEPSLAMGNGKIFLAYFHEGDGIRFRSGNQSDPPTRWESRLMLTLPGTTTPLAEGISVCLDSSLQPSVAYWLDSEPGDTIALWKSESLETLKVADTHEQGNDDMDLRLAFAGKQPRVAFYAARDNDFYNLTHQIWATRSEDGGKTWNDPVPIPNDGNASMGFPLALAVGTHGAAAVAAAVDGGNSGGVRCGQPKLARSGDMIHWATCGPGGSIAPHFKAFFPSLVFASNNKLYVAFQNVASGTKPGPGVILWREP